MKKSLMTVIFAAYTVLGLAILSPVSADVLKVERGKSKILQLKSMPVVVMLGDPEVADVVIERNRQIFLVGLQPGETNMFVLDDSGKKILDVDLVVTEIVPRHVTVNRGVGTETLSCNPRCVPVAARIIRSGGQSGTVGSEDQEDTGPGLGVGSPVSNTVGTPVGGADNSGADSQSQ